MKVIKKINNNVAVCVDNDGNELIAFGKGIGFPSTPYELNDLGKIERTFYGISKENFVLLEQISKDYFDSAAAIVDFASKKINGELNPNIVFTLADHISFAVDRTKKGMYIKMPYAGNFQIMYPLEMEVAHEARNYLNKRFKVRLSGDEEVSIAMHIINGETFEKNNDETLDKEQIIERVSEIIEKENDIAIDRKGFSYSRFLTHLEYLINRRNDSDNRNDDNTNLFEVLKKEYPQSYVCVQKIAAYFADELDWALSDNEMLYLMLHVNRLTNREG